MSGGRVERRLAAIVAADVAGYSRLMGLDEVGTARTLREHRWAREAPLHAVTVAFLVGVLLGGRRR